MTIEELEELKGDVLEDYTLCIHEYIDGQWTPVNRTSDQAVKIAALIDAELARRDKEQDDYMRGLDDGYGKGIRQSRKERKP